MKTIFVSSTFKDMHYERDIIQDVVTPGINSEAQKYGESISFCDLRWGINTGTMDEESGSQKVLDVCLNEIDRCNNPFIVVLGYRYGWIPENRRIEEAAQKKQFILDDLNMSVTALEIEYGALRDSEREKNTFFYFREIEGEAPEDYMSEDPEHAAKLKLLKERILDIAGDRVRTYTVSWNGSSFDGMQEFGEMISNDISAYLSEEWGKMAKLSEFEREKIIHDNFMENRAAQFKGREEMAERFINEAWEEEGVFGVAAESGYGKTTLLSYMAHKISSEGINTLIIYGGLTSKSGTGEGIIQLIIAFLESILGYDSQSNLIEEYVAESNLSGNDNRENVVSYYNHLMDELTSRPDEKLAIIIDGVDQIDRDEFSRLFLFFPKYKPRNVLFLVSAEETDRLGGIHGKHIYRTEEKEFSDIINGIVRAQGRELDAKVVAEISKRNPNRSPLYARLVIERLSLMRHEDYANIQALGDGMDAITSHQIEIVKNCPDETGKLCAEIIRLVGERINSECVGDIAALISATDNGLRPKDLEAIMGDKYNALDLAHMLAYMSDSFIIRTDGRIDFSHREMKNVHSGLKKIISGENHRRIFSYLNTLDLKDEVCSSEIVSQMMKAYGVNVYPYLYELSLRIIESKQDGLYATLVNSIRDYITDDEFGIGYINYIEENIEGDTWAVIKTVITACTKCENKYQKTVERVLNRIYQYEIILCKGENKADTLMHIVYLLQDMSLIYDSSDIGKVKIIHKNLKSIEIAREAKEIDDSKEIRPYLAWAYEKMSSLYDAFTNYVKDASLIKPDDNRDFMEEESISDELKDILGYFVKSIEIRRELYYEKQTPFNARRLINALTDYGDFLSGHIDHNRVEKQVRICKELYKEALEIYEKTDNINPDSVEAYSLFKKLGYFLSQTTEDPIDSINYLLKAYRIAETLYENNKSINSLCRLINICELVSLQYRQSPVKDRYRKSVEYAKRAKNYSEMISNMTRLLKDFDDLGMSGIFLAEAMEACIRDGHDNGDSGEYIKGIQNELYEAKRIFDVLKDYKGYEDDEHRVLVRLKLVDAGRLLGGHNNDHLVEKWLAEAGRSYPGKKYEKLAYAYAEFLELLTYMPRESLSKLSIHMIRLFERNKDRNYVNHLDPDKTLLEQDLSGDTITLLAMFTMAIWVENGEQAKYIADILEENERLYQESIKNQDE